MSGLEVVGLVFGVLPLAIEAIKGYQTVLSTMKRIKNIKHAERGLQALRWDLENELLQLRVHCEPLLEGIVPQHMMHELLEKPFGIQWKPYGDRILFRLYGSSEECERQVAEIEKLSQELMAKLCFKKDDKSELTDRFKMLRAFQRGTAFEWRRKEYEGIISKIRALNSKLEGISGRNCALEPSRRRRSQARVIHLIQKLSRSIFNALRNASTCGCVKSHEVCLELVHREAVLMDGDPEDHVAKKFEFHVVLGSYGDSERDEAPAAVQMLTTPQQPARWDSLYIQCTEFDKKPPSTPSPPPTLTVAGQEKPKRTVGWAASLMSKRSKEHEVISAKKALIEVSQSLIPALGTPLGSVPATVSNLCQTVVKQHKEPTMGCCGYITDVDVERKFGLYLRQHEPEFRSTVTLRQVLDGTETNLPPFGFLEKLKVARALSVSILHLYSTPWLATILTLDDVLFLREDAIQPSSDDSPYRPFLAKNLSRESESQGNKVLNLPRPMNPTILSLGALLIQVIIGRAIDTLDMTGTLDHNSLVSKCHAGRQFKGQVRDNGSLNYVSAVNWCLENFSELAGFHKEDFRQEFYAETVARLEKDIDSLTSDY